ncbi:MAG: DUF1275 domain-containing protein [Acidimicrobiaceae bacterium]|nr:DUF1275 domain-containing protein [Acidimicrobiaceae bacterium]
MKLSKNVWSSLFSDPKQGPLPALLLTLTVVTGLVDSVSILSLGRVFVANMTGNVAFIGFALAGAAGFSLSASLFALGGFLVGAFAGGVVIGRTPSNRGRLLLNAASLELLLMAVGVVVAQTGAVPYGSASRNAIAAVIAVAMGIQNAAARRLAVPDLTTTVLTMTLTGLVSDIRQRNHVTLVRRILAILTMLAGAAVGAVVVDQVRPSATLEAAAGLMVIVVLGTLQATRREAAWQAA